MKDNNNIVANAYTKKIKELDQQLSEAHEENERLTKVINKLKGCNNCEYGCNGGYSCKNVCLTCEDFRNWDIK